MTPLQWQAEVFRRIGIDEGLRLTAYDDTMGIKTIGIGFNLTRPDAPHALLLVGADYGAVMEGAPISAGQAARLFTYSFAPIVAAATASLQPTHYVNMSDARRFVLCDLEYNLGAAGWLAFPTTRGVIDHGCHCNAVGNHADARTAFALAASDLEASAWFSQVGDRARRNTAMLRSSDWVDANGNGS